MVITKKFDNKAFAKSGVNLNDMVQVGDEKGLAKQKKAVQKKKPAPKKGK